LNRYKFFIISPLLNDTLHHRYIVSALKIIIHDNIICFLFTNIRNVCNTKHNKKKLIRIVLENNFLHIYYSDFNDLKIMFHMVV